MSNFNLITEEKDHILKLHKKEVNNLLEQVAKNRTEALKFFQDAQKNKCLNDPNLDFTKVFSKQGTSKVYIKGVSQKTGNVKRVFDDNTWEIVDPNNKQLSSGRWTCEQAKPEPSKPSDPQETLKKYLDQWKGELSKTQGIVVDGIQTELEASDVIKQDWDKWPIPGSKEKFGSEKFLFVNPANRGKVSTSSQQAQEESFSDLDKKKCVGIIENYFNYYKTKPTGFSDSWFQNNKPKVQFCKNSFYKNWGILPKAGRLNNIIELMTRQIDTLDNVQSPPQYPEKGQNKHMWKLD